MSDLHKKGGKPESGSRCRQPTKGPLIKPAVTGKSVEADRSQRLSVPLETTLAQNSPDLQPLSPFRPYHERLAHYERVRSRIFGDISSICRKIKRSTLRMRNFWSIVKRSQRRLIAAIVNDQADGRLYAAVSFLDLTEIGLHDTGANISCIGADLAGKSWTDCPHFKPIVSHVKTADGKSHPVTGILCVDGNYNGICKKIDFYVIPSISKRVILGMNFWRIFDLAPGVISAIGPPSLLSEVNKEEEKQCPLTESQKARLASVINLFPNYAEQGLGKTSLLSHDIDVGTSKPIKQRF